MRPPERIPPMLEALREVWERYPDQRLGQLVAKPENPDWLPGPVRDVFNVEDSEMWVGLQRILDGEVSLDPPPWLDI